MPKIVFIGAGSVVFSRNLIQDILTWPALRNSTLCLMDVDAERLGVIEALAKRIVRDHEFPARIEATTDRRRALDGADYVLIMIQVGGIAPYEEDIAIPRGYGVDQTVGDTLGPGGVFRGLRTVPVLASIAQDMEELCPHAWMLQYSNPMAINCWGLSMVSPIKVVGLCHSVQGTAWQLSLYIGADMKDVDYWCAGINHMAWYLRYEVNGVDAYPRIRKAMDDPETFEKDATRFEVMRHFDYFVTESTHHMSEYLPYIRKNLALTAQFDPDRWDYLIWCKEHFQPHYDQARRQASGEEDLPALKNSNEYASAIIHAHETGEIIRFNGNVPNTGLITNLPEGACVEVPIFVDRAGMHPCHVGDLPPQLAALNRSNIAVQQLAAEAAIEGDARKAFQAVALDPLTAAVMDLRAIQRMVDDLFRAHERWLPQFGGLSTRAATA